MIIQINELEQHTNIQKGSGYTSRMTSEGYVLKIGFDLIKNPRVVIAPYLGLGNQNSKWNIDKEPKSKIENVLKQQTHESLLLEMQNINFGELGLMFKFNIFKIGRFIDFTCGGQFYLNSDSKGLWWLNGEAVDAGKTDLNGYSGLLGLGLKYNYK